MLLEDFCCVCSCMSLLCVKFWVSVSRYMLLCNLAFVILECSKFIHVGRLQNISECSWYSDSLQSGWPGDQISVGARFSAPVHTSSEAHPASHAVGTGSFLGVKWLWHGIDHPPPSSAEIKESIVLYLHSPSGPSWPVLG